MDDNDYHRIFQILPGRVHKDTGELEEEESDEGLTAYFLDAPEPIKTDVVCGGKKYVLTITTQEV